jgi:outer membrane receptor protein involved in Fe transport
VAYLLPALEIAVARERSAPPPVGARVLDPVAFRQAQSSDAYALFRDIGGLELHEQGQGPGYASNVSMRGFTSDHSSDVLLVIDGVPVNLPAHGHVEGYADWNVLMGQSVSSARVLHGNASPLYGDFALAGAVEVFTRADTEGTDMTFGGTSFGDTRGSLTTGFRRENGGMFVGVEGRRDEGWRRGAGFWLANGIVRGWRSVAGGRLEGGLSLYGTEWDSPGFVSIPAFNEASFQTPFDESDGGRSRRAVVHGRFAKGFDSGLTMQATGWAMASNYALFLHIPGHAHGGPGNLIQQSGEWDERTGVGGRLELGRVTGGGDLVLGFSARADQARYDHAQTVDRGVVNPEIGLDADYLSAAAYLRWRRSLGRLAVDLGGRVDRIQHASLSDLTPGAGRERSVNTVFQPKVGLAWRASQSWSLVGTSARGFRSPVGIIGDPSREPYIAWSHELGVQREGAGWTAKVTAFRVDVSNERIFDPITQRSTGAGNSTRQGFDADLHLELPFGVAADLGGTWNHARLSGAFVDAHDDHPHEVFDNPVAPDVPVGDGVNRVPGLADYRAHASLTAPIRRGLDGVVRWRVVGPHTPIGEPAVRTQPFSVMDLGASVDLGRGRALDVEVTNLLDIRFVELRSAGFVTPGVPRAIRLQLRWSDLPF